jgi:hypothetical protein
VKNITLTLYAFHLKQGLGDSLETTRTQGVQLWDSLMSLHNVYPFPKLENLKASLISYSKDEQGNYSYQPQNEDTWAGDCLTHEQEGIKLSQISTAPGFKLTGEIEPYLLNDTYCLTLTLNPEDREFELEVLDLSAFRSDRLIQGITADLGKVLIFYGEQHWKSEPTPEEANKWATSLCANTDLNPEFRGELILCNCPVFWFEASGLTLWVLLAKPNQFDASQFSDNAPMFRGLLWSFVKINSTYADVKEAYKNAKKYYHKLEKKVTEFYKISAKSSQERLQDLDTMIQSVPPDLLYYHCCLRDLQTHQTTIKTNLKNFKTSLRYLIAQGGTQLDEWSTLGKKTYPQYLEQIQLYLEHLEPGKHLFSDLINTIRATAEIERIKNEQVLQHHIQAVGIGITAGAIVASTSGLIIQPRTDRLPLGGIALHPLGWALLASVVCASGSWLLAEGVFKLLRGDHRAKKRLPPMPPPPH